MEETKLSVLTAAFQKCDMPYVLRTSDDGWTYLFFTGGREDEAERLTNMRLHLLLQGHDRFFEFEPDGSLASY